MFINKQFFCFHKEWTATLNITQEDGIKEVEIFKNEELTKDMPTGKINMN